MSTKSDPSQGMVKDPARPSGHKVPEPANERQFRQIQRAVNASDRASVVKKSRSRESDRQDWRKG